MSEIDELILESEIAKTFKMVSDIGNRELEIFSEITKEMLVKAPVEIELI